MSELHGEGLYARVAWAYYNEEMTQAEIADRMGMTRARVNRILQECRDTGLVQIIINSEITGCAGAEHALEKAFGLSKAVVVPSPARERHLYTAIGRAAGTYLSARIRDGQTLGLGWGTTLRASGRSLIQRNPGGIRIVSLFGGLPSSSTTTPYDVASVFSRRLNAEECYYIAAPMYAPSEQMRETLMTQKMFATIFEMGSEVDMALVGAGDLTNRSTNVNLGAITEDERVSLCEAGAVGEVFGVLLDRHGNRVEHTLNRRFMGPAFDRLPDAAVKILAAGGLHKVPVLRAALAGGYVDVLVTDELTAESLLALAGEETS
jgi:DNA-binding transcriptional regulator LsrR (DeoR family)